MTIRYAAGWSLFFLIAAGPISSVRASADEAALRAERDAAVEQVKRIVNQPVHALPYSADQGVGMYRPGWFHEGAARPDFLHVDVSRTQEFPYDRFQFVSSDVSPGLMFRGRDLEFNANTKLFYTDRTVPKKRLTPEEMTEINRLYRIIGEREMDLARLRGEAVPAPVTGTETSPAERKLMVSYAAGAVLLAVVTIVLLRVRAR
jgi:hypothetical protein